MCIKYYCLYISCCDRSGLQISPMYILSDCADNTPVVSSRKSNKSAHSALQWRNYAMKATGIVRRIDDLGRVVIPKEIRRTMRIREGDPSWITLTRDLAFCIGIESAAKRYGGK